jgi:hypothetical protein
MQADGYASLATDASLGRAVLDDQIELIEIRLSFSTRGR